MDLLELLSSVSPGALDNWNAFLFLISQPLGSWLCLSLLSAEICIVFTLSQASWMRSKKNAHGLSHIWPRSACLLLWQFFQGTGCSGQPPILHPTVKPASRHIFFTLDIHRRGTCPVSPKLGHPGLSLVGLPNYCPGLGWGIDAPTPFLTGSPCVSKFLLFSISKSQSFHSL